MKPKHAKPSKAKKYIIETITAIMTILFLVSICAIDSESIIPAAVMVVSLGWIALYAWANLTD